MAVTLSAPTTSTLNFGGTTTTVAFVSTGKPLYVMVTYYTASDGALMSTVAWNTSESLTRLCRSGITSNSDRAEIWRLAAPTSGTHNVVLTTVGGHAAGVVGIVETTGQDTGTPEGTPITDFTFLDVNGGTPAESIAGAASGDLTICCTTNNNALAQAPATTGGGSASELYDTSGDGEGGEAFSVPDAVSTVGTTWTGNATFALAAVTLKVVAAVQTAVPISDISAGGWTPSTGASLFGTIDETVADDSDYDSSGVTPTSDVMEVRLTSLSDPSSSTGHSVSYRVRKPSA